MKNTKEYSALIILMGLCFLPATANAHVKWFTAYDLNSPPRPLLSVLLNHQFLAFGAITTLLMFLVAYLDRYLVVQAHTVNHLLGKITRVTHNAMPVFLRLGVASFSLAVANQGSIILTPELTTNAGWVVYLQVALALIALHHRTALITGIFVDGKKVARVYGPWNYIFGLSPGPHTISVSLNNNEHETLTVHSQPIQVSTRIIQTAEP